MPARKPALYATQDEAADRFEVGARTIRNWIKRGLITGYRVYGRRGIQVRLDEIDDMLLMTPFTVARTPSKSFGPDAKIVQVGADGVLHAAPRVGVER